MSSPQFELTPINQTDGGRLSDLSRDLTEAANFATYFTASPASLSTAHLYISSLATWSPNSGLFRIWKSQFPRIPSLKHTIGQRGLDVPLVTLHGKGDSVAFSSDGTYIVCSLWDKSVQVWDASTGAKLKTLNGHIEAVLSVACSSDGTCIVSGSKDKSVRVWDASTGAELKTLSGHTGIVLSVALSSDGTRIVSGSSDNSVRVWDASMGTALMTLNGHTENVCSVMFSSDGTRIVSGSEDGSVRVWDASTGTEHKTLNGHTEAVLSVAFQVMAHALSLVRGTCLRGCGRSRWAWNSRP